MKRKFTIYLSQPLARRFTNVAKLTGEKSALIEKALDRQLDPDRIHHQDRALLRRMDEVVAAMSVVSRDMAIVTETLSLFVRYYLTVTPPVAKEDHDAARAIGRTRFEAFVAQVGQRLTTDRRLITEVLDKILAAQSTPTTAAPDDGPTPAAPAQIRDVAAASPTSFATTHGAHPSAHTSRLKETQHG